MGQNAKSATAPGMSPAGGIADEIRAKAEVTTQMSVVGGRPDLPQVWLELRFLATSRPKVIANVWAHLGPSEGLIPASINQNP